MSDKNYFKQTEIAKKKARETTSVFSENKKTREHNPLAFSSL